MISKSYGALSDMWSDYKKNPLAVPAYPIRLERFFCSEKLVPLIYVY